jgi:hypothetical protein
MRKGRGELAAKSEQRDTAERPDDLEIAIDLVRLLERDATMESEMAQTAPSPMPAIPRRTTSAASESEKIDANWASKANATAARPTRRLESRGKIGAITMAVRARVRNSTDATKPASRSESDKPGHLARQS